MGGILVCVPGAWFNWPWIGRHDYQAIYGGLFMNDKWPENVTVIHQHKQNTFMIIELTDEQAELCRKVLMGDGYKAAVDFMYASIGRDYGSLEPLDAAKAWMDSVINMGEGAPQKAQNASVAGLGVNSAPASPALSPADEAELVEMMYLAVCFEWTYFPAEKREWDRMLKYALRAVQSKYTLTRLKD